MSQHLHLCGHPAQNPDLVVLPCISCVMRSYQEAARNIRRLQSAVNDLGDLSELDGSPQQIEWARSIRRDFIGLVLMLELSLPAALRPEHAGGLPFFSPQRRAFHDLKRKDRRFGDAGWRLTPLLASFDLVDFCFSAHFWIDQRANLVPETARVVTEAWFRSPLGRAGRLVGRDTRIVSRPTEPGRPEIRRKLILGTQPVETPKDS